MMLFDGVRMLPNRSRGFTLIEMLVVFSILALLLGLIIPAVGSARESARRLECMNRLREIGIALQSHQATKQYYPSPMPPRSFQKGKAWSGYDLISGYYELLPH